MKDFLKKFRRGSHETLTPKEEALKGLVEEQGLSLVCSTASRIEKQLKTDKKRHRTGEVRAKKISQKQSIHNFEQRLLEKHKTRQKKERRMAA